jgi:hypothetical protein
MTDINKYNPWPDQCAICCPHCSAEASFEFPFTICNSWEGILKTAQADPDSVIERWGEWYVIVHAPDLFPWLAPPKGGYRRSDWGICRCPTCAFRAKHLLQWPDDAYYICEVKGKILWAWTRGHASALRDFVASPDREFRPGSYPGYFLFLRHIPTHFLRAKNRGAVVKQLDRLLDGIRVIALSGSSDNPSKTGASRDIFVV